LILKASLLSAIHGKVRPPLASAIFQQLTGAQITRKSVWLRQGHLYHLGMGFSHFVIEPALPASRLRTRQQQDPPFGRRLDRRMKASRTEAAVRCVGVGGVIMHPGSKTWTHAQRGTSPGERFKTGTAENSQPLFLLVIFQIRLQIFSRVVSATFLDWPGRCQSRKPFKREANENPMKVGGSAV